MDVAKSLRAARHRAGLSQAQLAGRAGTSQATISAYESRSKTPSVDTLERLLAATGSRLVVQAGSVVPSEHERARRGRTLLEVLAMAEALPTRHEAHLRYPRLMVPEVSA